MRSYGICMHRHCTTVQPRGMKFLPCQVWPAGNFLGPALIGEALRESTCRICIISCFVRIPTHEIQRRSKTHSTVELLDTSALGTKGSAFPVSFLSTSSPLPFHASPQLQIASLLCIHLGSRFFLIIAALSGCSTIYTAPILLP